MASPQSTSFLPVGYVLRNTERAFSYTVVKLLGYGGYGATYEVRDDHNRRLAVKELLPSAMVSRCDDYSVSIKHDPKAYYLLKSSFQKEAIVISSLADIKSVVRIYDYFYANNTCYYVMEFINGKTLSQLINEIGPLSMETYLPKFEKIMSDVQLLHERKVLHRDISPDNIMLTDDGFMKLIDFGSARFYEGSQHFTVSIKESFAPIEQYTPKGQGPYTDVYSMAATMYYCFTGKLIPKSLERLKSDALISPVQFGWRLSQTQEQALIKALSVKHGDRYQSMREFKESFFKPDKIFVDPTLGPTSWFGYAWTKLKSQPVLLLLSGAFYLLAAILQFI